MARELAFEKWHGLRNDFVLVDEAVVSEQEAPRLARTVCDRRTGVGGDGLLLVGSNPARMRVWNADGTRPEMCGNGLRCVAAFIASRSGMSEPHFELSTDAGWRGVQVRKPVGAVWQVDVDMGVAREGIDGKGAFRLDHPVLGEGHVVDVGNPHWIFFGGAAERNWLLEHGQDAEHDARFPARTNVEVVEEQPDGALRVTVWERGCGPTQACGTGASAVGWLACALGRRAWGNALAVRLPGGELRITASEDGAVSMSGPAERVFAGILRLRADE